MELINKKNELLKSSQEEYKKEDRSFFFRLIYFLNFKKNPFLFIIFLGVILNLGGIFLLYKNIQPSNNRVISHYNAFLGIDKIIFDLEKNYYKLFFASISGFIILLINSVLAFLIAPYKIIASEIKENHNKDERIARKTAFFFVLCGAFFIQLIILIYIWAVIRVNS